jgi:hypothetical protein
MATVLPVSSDAPHYTFQTDLAGVTYGLEFRWNDVANGWFLRLFDAEGVELMSAIRVVVGWPLMKRSQDSRLPAGTIWAFDTTGRDADPGRNDLGTRTKLLFFEAE